jgi:hypothetical protein
VDRVRPGAGDARPDIVAVHQHDALLARGRASGEVEIGGAAEA